MSIRFREPYTRNFVCFKPFETVGGLFGHGLFTPYLDQKLKELNESPIVGEGEFNQLQLQSLSLRQSEIRGVSPEYVFACAVGGVNNADFETLRRIARSPVICYDHDHDGAGFALVENARTYMSVYAFTTPQPESDLDSFIRSFGNETFRAWDDVKALVEKRQRFSRDYEGLVAQIHEIRKKQGRSDLRREFEINDEVAALILSDLSDRGKFFHDGRVAYFFSNETKRGS